LAADDLAAALRSGDMDRIWYSIQGVLVAAANVSKLLWPNPRDEHIPYRGEMLRQILGVPDDSPLRSRTLRNTFEHFDTRLEDWMLSSERHAFVDENVGPISMLPKVRDEDRHRHFDSTTWTVYFRGKAYELRPMIETLGILGPQAGARAAADRQAWTRLRVIRRPRPSAPPSPSS